MFTHIRTFNNFLSYIRHNWIHLTLYCFFQRAASERGICLFNGFWCVIHKVHNVDIPKRLYMPFPLTLRVTIVSSSLGFCIEVFSNYSIKIKCSWGIIVSWLNVLGVFFIGNLASKNVVSHDSIIVPTSMRGTPKFIIKNLYPTLCIA